jgi:hypothetical protein
MYLPYVFFSYNHVYGLYNNISEFFKTPYDTTLPQYMTGAYDRGFVNSIMPSIPSKVIEDSVLTNFKQDSMHKLRVALRDNEV